MANGLDDMTDIARAQVIAARDAMYMARQKALSVAAAQVRTNPVLTGALLAAAGAALAVLLPQTRAEHRVIGPVRDRIVDAAKGLLMDERLRVATAMHRLSQQIVSDTAGSDDDGTDRMTAQRPH